MPLCSKIELQFPDSGSKLAKDKLIKFRQQIFYRRINIELEKKMLDDWGEGARANVEPVGPEHMPVHKEATEHFSSVWSPRSTQGSVLLS